ncbi:MAG: hypothetical protein K1X91_01525 [Bacteriodetes bacterium]|nr:hypothetical protein [Bacteroidota bacterium]
MIALARYLPGKNTHTVRRLSLHICIMVMHIVVYTYCSAQDTTKKVTTVTNGSEFVMNARLGLQLGISAPDFFTTYRNVLRIPTSQFTVPLTFGAAAKFAKGDWSIGIDGEYFSADVNDNATVTINPLDSSKGSRKFLENISLTAVPIMLCAEIAPVNAQFHTYIGAAAGIGLVSLQWKEEVSSSLQGDTRIGGTLINESKVVPAFRIYSGIELGYDRAKRGVDHFGSLIIEVRYTYMPYNTTPFQKLAAQQPGLSASQELTIGASAVSVQIGVQFNLSRLR